jgi:hypothetical protein
MVERTIEVTKCRRCPAEILMLKHNRTRNPAPIELGPSADGNIHIDLQQGTYIILTKDVLEKARERGVPLHKNHFATCEYARSFSKVERAKALPARVAPIS